MIVTMLIVFQKRKGEYAPIIANTIHNLITQWVFFCRVCNLTIRMVNSFVTNDIMNFDCELFLMIICGFQNNYIKTSKYSVLTFLPLNLFEQFQRLANFYFLCLLVLQVIPAISSLTPITTAIPLIGVLTLTAVKDAYDDFVSTKLKLFLKLRCSDSWVIFDYLSFFKWMFEKSLL